jgi:hypothetical protein
MATNNKQSAPKPMSEKQVAFIRVLFKECTDLLTKEEQDNLTRIMKAHIDGTKIRDTRWAAAAIDKMRARKTQAALAKAKEIKAKKAQMQNDIIEDEEFLTEEF